MLPASTQPPYDPGCPSVPGKLLKGAAAASQVSHIGRDLALGWQQSRPQSLNVDGLVGLVSKGPSNPKPQA